MNNAINYQQKFNTILLENVPKNLSLAQEISELLGISIDSAYRRLRDETEYSLSEATAISIHFNIPLESLNNEISSVATFRINHLDQNLKSYEEYLKNMLVNIKQVATIENAHIYFAAEDIPVFYHFKNKNLMQFKISYWLKSLLNVDEFQHKDVEDITIPNHILEIANAIYHHFEEVSSTEIWTEETILSTVKQIRFYWDAGFFKLKETAFTIIEDLEDIMNIIKKNCDLGFKFSKGNMSNKTHTFYFSDLMIGNNSILVKTDQRMSSFISYSTFNFMETGNIHFNEQNKLWLSNIISKSTLISTVAEKQRNQFFKNVQRILKELKEYIRNTE